MNLTIDPDVFYAAKDNNSECKWQLLEDLRSNKKCYTYNIDYEDIIIIKYMEFIEANKSERSGNGKVLSRFLIELLFEDNPHSLKRLPKFPSDLHEIAQCSDPVEQQMLKMAVCKSQTLSNHGLYLLLTGLEKDSIVRCLNNRELKDTFCEKIPGLEVKYACDKKPVQSWKKKTLTQEQHSYFFEREVGYLIMSKFKCFNNVEQEKIEGEEVDVYCYQKEGNPRIVVIGECKLRFNNSDKFINSKEIKQLVMKINAVDSFERKRKDVSEHFKIIPLIISNANNMDDDAWEDATKLENFRFYHVKMPSKWQAKLKWSLIEENLSETPPPSNG